MSFAYSKDSHSSDVNRLGAQNGEEPRMTVSYPQSSNMPVMSSWVKLKEGASAFKRAMMGFV